MSKKYFVVSDVHGFYDEFINSLEKAGFDYKNNDHVLVSCGDLLDRGHKPAECLDFVMNLPEDRRILVRGNHEDLLENILKTYHYTWTDKYNGTYGTICDLTDSYWVDVDSLNKLSHNETLREYFNSLVDFSEINNYIFVHSWYPWGWSEDWRDAPKIKWERARWSNPFECWHDYILTKESDGINKLERDLGSKTLIFGHWHTSYAHHKFENNGKEFPEEDEDLSVSCFGPFYGDKIIGIDACTAFSHQVNCLVLED